MADLCFICDKSLAEGDIVNVVRGLNTMKTASIERNDGNIEFLKTLTSVNVHESCRKVYISKNCIAAYKRRLEEEQPSTSSTPPRRRRTEDFDASKLCLFCGEAADEKAENKKNAKYRRVIRRVSTTFMESVIEKVEHRSDLQSNAIKNRLLHHQDSIAASGSYHLPCFRKFLKPPELIASNQTLNYKLMASMKEIFHYIENSDDSQFTLKELQEVITEYVPDDKTIITKLRERYSTDIIITTKPKSFTIISFRDAQADLSKIWYENRKNSPHEERLRIVEAAAAIIREDIRSTVLDCKSYPSPNSMLENINEEIPERLLHLLHEIILKNRKGNVDHLTRKCTSISHAIMATMRQRSFSSQLLLGLSVFLHRRYASKRLIDILSSLGFCAPYLEAVRYEVSLVYHPQPRILPLESGTLVQYVGDNADVNVNTLDGHNTVHVMGMIQIVTPKSAVISDDRMQICTSKPTSKDLASVSHVPLLTYEKPLVPGFSKIQFQNLNNLQVLTEQKLNAVDFLWLYGKSRNISPLPGWNGYLEQLTRNNKNFSTSQVLFLPFIDHPASNLNTIHTTLQCAINYAKIHGQKTCVITFDQPLYSKAREMVAAADANSDLSQVIVKLGGFHTIMSFLGCIGYLMDGSGIKEALSQIYAPKSIDKMLDGHAYSRSIRAHTLLRLALSKIIFEEMKFESEVLDKLIEDTTTRYVPYDDVEGCASSSQLLIDQFHNKLDELKSQRPTAQLWVQYFEMVSIALDFIRAERLGLFKEHLNAVQKMLPYFHASGRFLYAKSAHLYLQDMLKLKETMEQQTFENFKNRFFTVKRIEKFSSGTWTDMVIEQSLMRSMKTEGGLSRGRSMQNSVLCKWVYGMYATNTICDLLEKFCNVSLDCVDQHVDARDSRVQRDDADVMKLLDWFNLHNPFTKTKQIVSIASGIVGNDKINCHRARDIGIESMMKIAGLNFNEVKLKRADKVLPISAVNKSIKINDCKVSVDPLLLFQRITVNKKFEHNLKEYLQYELSPYPTSLFDNSGMRKTTKSKLYNNMAPVNVELDENNITYIIDGGFLLHRVVWGKDDTISIILEKYAEYLQTHYGSNVIVVFDGYADNCKNVKAMEQRRRTAPLLSSYEVSFHETMVVPISQEKFLSNRSNKKKFIEMLIRKLETFNIDTKQARDDADVHIVETAIAESQFQKTAVIVGEDTDLLIILIGRTQSHQHEIFFKKIGKGNVETKMYSSKSFDKYPRSKKHILFLHAFSGCDTTSALFKKGKLSIIKVFEKISHLEESAQVFQQENYRPELLFEKGMRFFLHMYNASKTETNLDNLRYMQFIKSTRLNKPVQLSSLPPTSAAARQHINRVYYQIQTWLGNELEPQEWGWMLQNQFLEPITTLLPPAPEELLNTIFCNCKKGCGSNCGCRKVGLQCSSVCGQCSGQGCLNAPSHSDDINEEIEYVPEILEAVESNIVDDEHDDIELEVEELQMQYDDDDDDEEEE